jgi:NitT/TauT family transport system substrate-binding protein
MTAASMCACHHLITAARTGAAALPDDATAMIPSFGRLLLKTLPLCGALLFAAAPAQAQAATALHFALDRPVDGTAAPFVLAADKGLFRAEDLAVTMDAVNGSADAIARVAAGERDMALADLNALIRYRDGEGAPPVKAVFVLYNKAPYAIIARRSRGIATMTDLAGKTVGAAEGDLAIRLWPAIARRNDIRRDKVRIEKIAAAVREPMLSAGQLDAVAGSALVSAINLHNRGIPANDLAVLRFADFGGEVYGHALIVNPAFAASRPEAVAAFVRATIAGVRLARKDQPHALDAVMARMSASASHDIELERWRATLRDAIVTDEVKRDGLGGIDAARFEAGVAQLAEDGEFRKRPLAADIFDPAFLPPLAARSLDPDPAR